MPVQAEQSAKLYSNLGHVLTHLVMILYATAVLHLPQVFDLSYGELLGLASLGLVLYGVAALPAGWFGDRWSQVGMMIIFFIGVGLSCLIVGYTHGTTQLYIGLTLLGLFASIYHPVGIAWLIASSQKQGMTMGINGLFGGIGSALAAPFAGLMIDFVSWRYAFIVPGVISLVTALAMFIGWQRGTVIDVTADNAKTPLPAANAQRRAFFVLTLTMACTGFVYAGLTNTMPKLFEQGLNAQLVGSYTEVGLYVGAITATASLTNLPGGWLADHWTPRTTYIVFWLMTVLPLFFIPWVVDEPLLIMVALALAFVSGFTAAENMLVARYTPLKWRSIAYGSKFVLALGIGGLTVELAGHLFDLAGNFNQLYLLLGGAALAATIATLLLPAEVG